MHMHSPQPRDSLSRPAPMKRVLLALPHDFVQALDAIAKRDNTTRSEVIRDSIRGRLRWEWEQQQKRGEPDPPSL